MVDTCQVPSLTYIVPLQQGLSPLYIAFWSSGLLEVAASTLQYSLILPFPFPLNIHAYFLTLISITMCCIWQIHPSESRVC
ncbi:hypothetical protein BDW75DRAFT_53301 [Aspergillus navahoensis]